MMTRKEEAENRKRRKLQAERERVAGMRRFERQAVLEAFGAERFPELASEDPSQCARVLICGIDEAGRGPLAGPVAAGACILPVDHDILWLNDSKKLSARKREELYEVIVREAEAFCVALVSPERIDEINILQATYEAMREAVAGLRPGTEAASRDTGEGTPAAPPVPQVLINDAVTIPEIALPQVPVIRGDAQCLSVAAASILAKVTRDRLMQEADRMYPEYGFARNKGYGTAEHIEALRRYGPCPIHRRTFITHFVESV